MPEFPSEEDKQELQDISEHVAAYKAMPLREIEALENSGKIARLNCGHRKALRVWLLVGENMRCRDCYEEGMRRAEKMIGK